MFEWMIALQGLGVLLLVGVLTWLLSLVKRDVSIVNSVWSLFLLAAVLTYGLAPPPNGPRLFWVYMLVGLWAIRLCAYLTWRNWSQPEDRRYQEIRRSNEPHFEIEEPALHFSVPGGPGLADLFTDPTGAQVQSAFGYPGLPRDCRVSVRPRLRNPGRLADGPVQIMAGKSGAGDGPGAVALFPAPQLFRGVLSVVGFLSDRPIRRRADLDHRVTAADFVSTAQGFWRSSAGERYPGTEARLSGLPVAHQCLFSGATQVSR